MKWTLKKKPSVPDGTKRLKKKFLWLPCKIGLEVRWLCIVYIEQYSSMGYSSVLWFNKAFIDTPAQWYLERNEELNKKEKELAKLRIS